jgi:CubicO group peptidase (beta-lactamase class C family)
VTALAPIAAVLEAGRADGLAPALAAVVRARGVTVHASVHGTLPAPAPRPLREGDRFDVASLTKVMATTTLVARRVADGALELDAPVARWLPAFAAAGKGSVTVRHLLAHASGLPSWKPWFAMVAEDPRTRALFAPPGERPAGEALAALGRDGVATMRGAIFGERLEAAPGARARYGDPAFIVLGWLLEAVDGRGLAASFDAEVARPLGLAATSFRPVGAADPVERPGAGAGSGTGTGTGTGRPRVEAGFAPTERCPHRHEVNQGDVNDDNAWAMGGVAGHAGLFSTAADVAALGQAWLDAVQGRDAIVPAPIAAEFARRDGTPGSDRALGWDTPSRGVSALGTRLGRGPRGAIGHLGYTGCSLWLELDREVVCALLTNHCHPDGSDKPRIRAFRARFHDAVAESLGI